MKRCFIIFLSVLAFSGCKEFFEPSLEKRQVIILAPGNNTESNSYSQNFWWEPVSDALTYRVQLVTPSFDSISKMLVDTLVASNKFTYTLDPGVYQWRVRAENGSSESPYAVASFTIHESTLQNQQVILQSPGPNFITNQRNITYSWQGLFGATLYRLQVDTNNFQDDAALVVNNTTANLQFQIPISKDGIYQWRVRGENNADFSKWSTINKVTFDSTPPGLVVLSSPASGTRVFAPVTLNWQVLPNVQKYELVILKSDSSTVLNNSFPVSLTANAYSFNGGLPNDTLYWKVRAVDAAGNKGGYSALRHFILQ